MKFYKYPECEPLKAGVYLCVIIMKGRPRTESFESLLFDTEKQCFTGALMASFEVIAYTNLTAEEAAQNAEI